MKTQQTAKNEHAEIINNKIEQAYTLIVSDAIELLKRFEAIELRTYCEMEHMNNELNHNFVREFLCCFWNITLVRSLKDCRYIVEIDLSKESLEKFGSDLTSQFFFKIYSVFYSSEEGVDLQYSLKVNFIPLELLNYYYSVIARGETEYISITTINHSSAINQLI